MLVVAVFAIRNPRSGTGSPAADQTSSATSPSSSRSSGSARSAGSSSVPLKSVSPSQVLSISSSPGSSGSLTLAQAKQVPLVVLNNTTVSGLAAQAAQRFRSAGWTVTSYGNLQNDILSTCAYYDPSVPDAKAAARVLKHEFPTIKRVRPKFAQLPAGPIVVVLTPDYSAG